MELSLNKLRRDLSEKQILKHKIRVIKYLNKIQIK